MRHLVYIIPFLFIMASCEEILFEDDISSESVHLVAPSDNAEFFSTGITFTWEPIAYGGQYRIQIAKPDFDNPLQIIADNIIDTTSYTTQLNLGEYQWRVQAVNSGYSSLFSTRSFTIVSNEDFENNSVTLTAPANNLITNQSDQNILWQPVLGATAYNFQVIDSGNSTVVFEDSVEGTNYPYTFQEGNYSWRVRATSDGQNTLFSSRSILVDTTPPNTPVLNSPANLSNTSDNDVTFQWARTPMPGSTEMDSLYIFTNEQLTNLEYKNQQTSPYSATLAGGTYYWYVKSFDQAGNAGGQSTVFSFTLN